MLSNNILMMMMNTGVYQYLEDFLECLQIVACFGTWVLKTAKTATRTYCGALMLTI